MPTADVATPRQEAEPSGERRKAHRIGILILFMLMCLADFLFWGHSIGLSMILFSAGLTGAALISLRLQFTATRWTVLAAIWVLCALPVVEYTQFMSVVILWAGHWGLLIWCALQSSTLGPVFRNLALLFYLIPLFSVFWAAKAFRNTNLPREFKPSRETVMAWVLPVVAGGVFVLLFLGANPLFERWIDRLLEIDVNIADPERMTFWVITAFAVLPFVAFADLAKSFKSGGERALVGPKSATGFINQRSITISLILFNAMFLTQNATDVAFLWAGAALPDGMTYAQFAHQGAYPLMATSILAGVFVLISRRFSSSAPLLKLLLLVWIAQNIFLVFSAFARLGLYVDVYGLTYLRVRAGIGMGLVVVGMALLAGQLWFNRSNAWVTSLFAGIFAATLYAGCFVNFGHVIAQANLAHQEERLDVGYLCRNAPLAIKALEKNAAETGNALCEDHLRSQNVKPEGWRDWGLREARLGAARAAYLEQIDTGSLTSINPVNERGYGNELNWDELR
ncbi:MAG: DUF4173 domain-containing protein [Pseudomonadota bacterium]